jgi:GntR family transcriptional regulator
MQPVKRTTPAPAHGGWGRTERPLPLYEVLKRKISEMILLGHWPPGSVIPSEMALADEYSLAVGTVRRALTDLAAEGMLSRRPKTGTTVTGRSPNHSLRFFFQFFRLHRDDGGQVRSKARLLLLERGGATAEEERELNIAEGTPVIRLDRLRSVDRRPVMHELLVLPAARVRDFPQTARKAPELLYLHLLEQYGIRVTAVRERLAAELATPTDRSRLNLTNPSAVLVIAETAYDQDGHPIIFGHHRTTTDGFRYLNEVR